MVEESREQDRNNRGKWEWLNTSRLTQEQNCSHSCSLMLSARLAMPHSKFIEKTPMMLAYSRGDDMIGEVDSIFVQLGT